jgi:sigma-B regulation protein RsbU (phosphoserine phosphatase)
MTAPTVLIVSAQPSPVRELPAALREGGFEVRQVTADELDLRPEPGASPDTLLVSADLGLQRIALLSERFAVQGQLPTTIVYPESDVTQLDTCVRGGFDYVAPPFRPALLRMRLTSQRERGELTMAVEEMANAASLSVHERNLSIARTIQRDFLPYRIPVPGGWQVAVKFRPAHQVAGDFYDVFEVAGQRRLAVVVADVCDKGIGAAMFVALIRTMLRHGAEQASESETFGDDVEPIAPAAGISTGALTPVLSIAAGPLLHAVSGTNSYMARHHHRQGYFCTLIFAMLEPSSGALLYVNAGHNPAILVRPNGRHTLLPPTGPAIGVYRHSRHLVAHVRMEPGDRLFMYTDGVPEARNSRGEFFGMDRVLGLVTRQRGSADALVEEMDAAVRQHTGNAEQYDDITMLALHRLPAENIQPEHLAH